MKKIKKSLISVLLASSCLFSAVGMNSSADLIMGGARSGRYSLNSFERVKEKYELVAFDEELSKRYVPTFDLINNKAYYFPDCEGSIAIETRCHTTQIDFEIMQPCNETAIEELINETFDSSYEIKILPYQDKWITYYITENPTRPETIKLAKELKEKLEQQCELDDFDYLEHFGDAMIMDLPYGYLGYSASDKTIDEIIEILSNYLEENNIDASVEVYDHGCFGENYCQIITNDMTQEERFSLAMDIREDTGISPMDTYLEGGGGGSDSIQIDMLNSVEGDANNDGQLTIADATAIVQALGNADEYALSAQGEYNADSDNDGLTGMDAVRIQETLTQSYEMQ